MGQTTQPLVAVVMGSKSDWETMRHCDETLTQFGVLYGYRVLSAHRTPQLAFAIRRRSGIARV